jgi:serine/threonine-protein kinase RsbW
VALMQHDPNSQQEFDPRDPLTHWHHFSGTTGQNGIRTVLLEVATRLDLSPITPTDLRENTILVLSEVLNNIEEHGYEGREGGALKVKLGIRAGKVEVETRDFGGAMPGLEVPKKRAPKLDVPCEELQEGGFGWYMIHTLAPDPQYTRRGQTNILRFTVSEN